MADWQKKEDAILDALSKALKERDQARVELAAERVAHRLTKKELLEVTGMVLK